MGFSLMQFRVGSPSMCRSRLLWPLCAITLLVTTSVEPARAAQYRVLNNADTPFYDYAPSVLWDGTQWRAWWCGLNLSRTGDAIYHSSSANGVDWSTPTQVFSAADVGPGAIHTCDPSVLM